MEKSDTLRFEGQRKVDIPVLLYGYGSWRSVVSFELYPRGFCRMWKHAVSLNSLSGENGDVIVVIFDRKKLVAVLGIGDYGAFEKSDVFGRVVDANGYPVFAC
jgi:hypothetical protein